VPARMEAAMETTTEYGDARECLQAARQRMRQVKQLLSQNSPEAADESASLLRDIEVQLGCVAAILRQDGSKPDLEFRASIMELQDEVAFLARYFAEADKMFSGWLHVVRSRRGGYTNNGHAAPLVLVKKLSVEG
jgi:hypothetical protein